MSMQETRSVATPWCSWMKIHTWLPRHQLCFSLWLVGRQKKLPYSIMKPYLKVQCRYILYLSQIISKNYIKELCEERKNKSIITTCHVKKSFKLTKYKFWLSSSHWCANRLQHTNNVDKYTNGRNKKVAEDDVEHNKVDSIFDL